MSAAVMDAGTHLKRPWGDEDDLPSPADVRRSFAMPALATTLPYPAAASTILHPSDRKLPPISTALDRSVEIASIEGPHCVFPKADRTSRLPPRPYSPLLGGPMKRPRYSSERDLGLEPITTSNHDGFENPERNVPEPHMSEGPWFTKQPSGPQPAVQECHNCFDTKAQIQNVISGLIGLESELRLTLAGVAVSRSSSKQEHDTFLNTEEASDYPLRQALAWATNSIDYSTRMVRDLAISRALPPMAVGTPGSTPRHDPMSTSSAAAEVAKRRFDQPEPQKDRFEDSKRTAGPSAFEEGLARGLDPTSMPSMMPESQRRSYPTEQHHPPPSHSPHRTLSSSGSIFNPSGSPMQMPPNSRMLPSPSSLHFPQSTSGLPAISSSPAPSQSAHVTHLQDLQHQISTKTLALQTLQREHDTLLAAFSRQQTRCATLDKKSQVSDNEINSLTEEKIRLQSQVETLETQVEELIKSRDDAHKQSVANGAQYMQIMAMSSRLQAQGANDMKRWKSEKEDWDTERNELRSRIEALESKRSPSVPVSAMDTTGSTPPLSRRPTTQQDSDDILTSTSLEVLRREIMRLRKSCHDMEGTLRDLQGETSRMDAIMRDFASVRDRISTKMGQQQAPKRSTPTPGPSSSTRAVDARTADDSDGSDDSSAG